MIGPQNESDPWSDCARLAGLLDRPAHRVGLLAAVYNGETVVRRGQRRIWSAAPCADKWRLVWCPGLGPPHRGRRGLGPQSVIMVPNMIAAYGMIAAALESLHRSRVARPAGALTELYAESDLLVVDGVQAGVRRPMVEIPVVRPVLPGGLPRSDAMPRPAGCLCLEEGDSPCPVHGDES